MSHTEQDDTATPDRTKSTGKRSRTGPAGLRGLAQLAGRSLMHLLIVGLLVLAFDRALYAVFFRQYDKLLRLTRLEKPVDVLIVGSSNLLWALDADYLAARTKLRVNIITIAGGDTGFRLNVLKEYLRRHGPPRLFVLQTDAYLFDRHRYQKEAYRQIEGYYPAGLLSDYIRGRWDDPKDLWLNTISASHALNSQKGYIGTRVYEKFAGLVEQVTGYKPLETELPVEGPTPSPAGNQAGTKNDGTAPTKTAGREQSSAGKTSTEANTRNLEIIGATPEARLALWHKTYSETDRDLREAPALVAGFEQTVELIRRHTVTSIFLEPPAFPLPYGQDRIEAVRERIRKAAASAPHIRYIRDLPGFGPGERSNANLFFDPAHVNVAGRIAYSKAVAELLIQASGQ